MQNLTFASILRTLLVRIRALESSRSRRPWPPSTDGAAGGSLYRVAPTAWGVAAPSVVPEIPATTGEPVIASHATPPTRRSQRRLEIPVFRLPVPRGLPAT